MNVSVQNKITSGVLLESTYANCLSLLNEFPEFKLFVPNKKPCMVALNEC